MTKNILLTYDVNLGQSEVKEALKTMGYSDKKYGNSSEINFKLPQNTVWKEANDMRTSAALTEINNIVTSLNKERTGKEKIVLEKAFAVIFINWSAIDSK